MWDKVHEIIGCHCSFVHLFKKQFLSIKHVWTLSGTLKVEGRLTQGLPSNSIQYSHNLDRVAKNEFFMGKDCIYLAGWSTAMLLVHIPENDTQQAHKNMCLYVFSEWMKEWIIRVNLGNPLEDHINHNQNIKVFARRPEQL